MKTNKSSGPSTKSPLKTDLAGKVGLAVKSNVKAGLGGANHSRVLTAHR